MKTNNLMVLASNIANVLFNMFCFILVIIFILYIDTFFSNYVVFFFLGSSPLKIGLGPGSGRMIRENRPEYGHEY